MSGKSAGDDYGPSEVAEGRMKLGLPVAKSRFEAGNPLALYDALKLCRAADAPLPSWASDGLMEFLREAMISEVKGKRGRGNSFLGEVRKARTQEVRSRTVWSIREVQSDRAKWMVFGEPLRTKFLNAEIFDFGSTEEHAFEIAARCLRGTFAQGAASTMRSAYYADGKGRPAYIDMCAFFETEIDFGLRFSEENEPNRQIPHWLDHWVETGEIK